MRIIVEERRGFLFGRSLLSTQAPHRMKSTSSQASETQILSVVDWTTKVILQSTR